MNTTASLLCLVALAFSGPVSAQLGYMRKGNSYVQGEVFDQGPYKNNRQLVITENTKPIIYTPDQVQEYGLIKGDVYIKRMVHDGQKTTPYFLLRLVDGDRRLYELKEKKGTRFFIERDTLMAEIKKELPLTNQLSTQLKPCSPNQQFVRWTRYKRTSLKRVVLLSNACYNGFFPRLRIGALTGLALSSQSLETVVDHIFLEALSTSPLVGIFADMPLGMSRSWSIMVQATYQQSNFGKYQANDNTTVEYQYNFSSLGFPLLFKYKGSSAAWRPFIGFGPTPAINWQQQNAWLSTTNVGSIAYLNQGTWDNVKKFQISGTLCAGLEYSITPAKSISLELRYKKLIDAQLGPTQSLALLGSFYF